MGLLSLAIWTPIAFGIVLLALGRDDQANSVRWVALIGSLVSLLVTLPLYGQFDNHSAAMQFVENAPWIERFNISYHLGIDGISFGRDGLRSAAYLKSLAQFLIGEDPLYPERIWQKLNMQARMLHLPDTTIGTMNIAIWDIVGKKFGQPLYKIFGAYRDRVMVYASSGQFDATEAYLKQVHSLQERGFKGLISYIFPARPIAILRC